MKTTLRRTNLACNASANDNALRPYRPVDWSALDRPEAPAAPAVKVRRPVLWHLLDQPEA